MNWKMLFEITLSLFCLIGLIVQTSDLLDQYLSGRTVVNIRLKRLQNEKIPSFTICYPCYMSMAKAAEVGKQFKEQFEKYKQFLDLNSRDPNEYNEQNNKILENMYYNVYNTIAIKKTDTMPVLQLFDRLSLPFNRTINETVRQSIEVEAHGIYHHSNGTIDYINIKDMEPIESLSAEYMSRCIRKCYTFFSALRKKWTDFELELDYLTINVSHDNLWFPSGFYDMRANAIFFAMHSPNLLPSLMNGENFVILQPQVHYLLTYSQIITELLGNRFDTNCRDYDLKDNRTHINMRSDCVSLCIVDAMKGKCRIDCVFQTEALLRKQLFMARPELRYCPQSFEDKTVNKCLASNVLLFKSLCAQSCQYSCRFKYYNYDLKEEKPLPESVQKWPKRLFINVRHNRMPDEIVMHYPEMTFISFVSSFGGLLGMWLGMSVLATFGTVYRFFERQTSAQNKAIEVLQNNACLQSIH